MCAIRHIKTGTHTIARKLRCGYNVRSRRIKRFAAHTPTRCLLTRCSRPITAYATSSCRTLSSEVGRLRRLTGVLMMRWMMLAQQAKPRGSELQEGGELLALPNQNSFGREWNSGHQGKARRVCPCLETPLPRHDTMGHRKLKLVLQARQKVGTTRFNAIVLAQVCNAKPVPFFFCESGLARQRHLQLSVDHIAGSL